MTTLLTLPRLTIRELDPADAVRLASLGDNYNVWRNTSDRFPHPYRLADAEDFIAKSLADEPRSIFAIALNDEAIGAIEAKLGQDIHRVSAELGYWLGEPYWGQGYATEAVGAFVPWALTRYDLVRMSAFTFTWNAGSARVLEKCGFELTAHIRKAAIKEGRIVDELLFSRTVGDG